ncbi:MAG: T9SS C-terminal target domain-containing protein, partial [Prevotellaceae bacterium]|nr:T9SS C-terminal target domain-containing protein [Prevotellaceae bacterium]
MKKQFFLFLLIFSAIHSNAQTLPLTAANNAYTAGDVVVKQQVEYKDPLTNGQGAIWDFAFLQ